MGVVYLVRQLSLGRLVALKTLPADLAGDPVALARFQREIRALARCDHPHTVKVLASGTLPDGQLYYTMEYVPGCDLERLWRELAGAQARVGAAMLGTGTWARAVLEASRKTREQTARERAGVTVGGPAAPADLPLAPLPVVPELPDDPGGYVRHVVLLVRDAARALQAVHDLGLVHRDVKPGNLMVTPDGERVVLMDFGLAKGAGESLSASRHGGLLGTLRYAAPEQLAALSLKVGPAADVRGLGVTLWELLTRRRLFAEAGDEKQLAALVHDVDVPRLRALDRTFDRDLEAIVARATERRAADRIPTAGRLADYLQLYLDRKPLPIRTPGIAEQMGRWLAVRKALVGSAAAVATALALGAVLTGVLTVQRRDLRHGVTTDLAEVARLREQSRWVEARAVLKRARERLAGGGPAELGRQVEKAGKDLTIAARLEEIPFLLTRLEEQSSTGEIALLYDRKSMFNAYREAFQDYDIDVPSLEPAEAADRVRASAIREQLVAALDFWGGESAEHIRRPDRQKGSRSGSAG
jgi:serine/threonine protein kinase